MKIKAILVSIFLLVVGVIVWAETSSKEQFLLAKDFPGGALVYVQVTDLPQFIKLWDESKLKEKYLNSENFSELQKRHLGIKIAERWNDWNNAVGFPLDLQNLGGLAEKQVAVAIYDVGKLDIVFVAPMNKAIFSATMFAQNSGNFEEYSLNENTTAYVINAEVERGKQKQKMIFANIKGRFVLATNENLFLEAVSQINGKQKKQSLYDEPDFKKLSDRISPNLATIWLDQDKLNSDYYFKRYWLMSDIENLKNIRAGICDINLSENGLTEKREYLLKEANNSIEIAEDVLDDLHTKIPHDVPFYRLRIANQKALDEAILDTILDTKRVDKTSRRHSSNWSYSRDEGYYENNYRFLNSDFDEAIDDPVDQESTEIAPERVDLISDALISSNPLAILTAISPKVLKSPLFVEFNKIAVISLNQPSSFHVENFENSITEAITRRLSVANTNFAWGSENGIRKLEVPMLGWEICYQLRDGKLFVSNNYEYLQRFAGTHNESLNRTSGFADITVVSLQNRDADFNQIMQKLSGEGSGFFTGNVGSLLGVMGDIGEISIKRKTDGTFAQEEITARKKSGNF